MSHAAFYGVGAYISSLLAIQFGTQFLVGAAVGMIFAALLSFIVSLPSLRLHGDYFVIATFGFQIIFFSVFNNWVELTRGPLGIPGIPQPIIFGWTIRSNANFFMLTAIFASLAYIVVGLLSSSPFGRVLQAIREDETFVRAIGKNAFQFKVTAFAVSAALAALAGSLYAHYITYIDPTSFTVMESVLVISMVIVGGAGSKWGAMIGAPVLVILPELLRFAGFPSTTAANLRQIIYGILLVVMMITRPRGLVGRYDFGR
jgi:branched-chain amino acid transport system permease protein